MDSALSIVAGAIVLVAFLLLVVYVTWLLAVRLRSKESPPESFIRWLRNLFDLAQGL